MIQRRGLHFTYVCSSFFCFFSLLYSRCEYTVVWLYLEFMLSQLIGCALDSRLRSTLELFSFHPFPIMRMSHVTLSIASRIVSQQPLALWTWCTRRVLKCSIHVMCWLLHFGLPPSLYFTHTWTCAHTRTHSRYLPWTYPETITLVHFIL